MANKETTTPVTTTPKVAEAVGVQKNCWFVGLVNNNTEKQCARKLEQLGYECFVPAQAETRLWRNGARKVVDRILLPCMLLIHATEAERKKIVNLPYISRFMTNRAGATDPFGKHPIAVIPESQIARLKFMLGHSDEPVEFEPSSFRLYDKVRITRGGLAGAEGHIVECGDTTFFAIRVDFLGVAKVKVKYEDLERM